MFRENKRHLQFSLLSDLNALPAKHRTRLDDSWAGTFRREVFSRLDETALAVLYSHEPSRPNVPVNVLLGLETLKAGFGWSDQEMYDAFLFNVQVRYALGMDSLGEGEFELRTVYNFRHRLSAHMQRTGENLVEKAFVQITDEQVAAFQLKTGRLRMDSTQIASNIRQMSRVQLLVEMLQRVHRMLSKADQARYADAFAPYLKGSSGQYVYHLKGEDTAPHLQRIGELMQRLLAELAAEYAAHTEYQLLQRMFQEQFTVTEPPAPPAVEATFATALPAGETSAAAESELPASAPVETPRTAELAVSEAPAMLESEHATPTPRGVQAKPGADIRADSLQSPDDPDATYRTKGNQGYQGYVANVTETCDPANPFQLIVQTQTASNTTEDADLLRLALPDLKARLDVKTLYNDGAFCSPAVDRLLRAWHIEQVPTGLRGKPPNPNRWGLADFRFECDDQGHPWRVTCPQGQSAEVAPGRSAQRYLARFACEPCPLAAQCPTQIRKQGPRRSLPFSQVQLEVALRRQRCAQQPEAKNLRTAIEATLGAFKRPFPEDQLPVRGRFRVACMVIGSALMVNVRRIQRYVAGQRHADRKTQVQREREQSAGPSRRSIFVSLWERVRRWLRPSTLMLAPGAFRF